MAAIEGHKRLIDVLTAMASERAELGVIARKHNRIHCHMLMECRSRSDLVQFLRSHSGALDLRTWSMALLELAGVRTGLRRMYRRIAAGNRLPST